MPQDEMPIITTTAIELPTRRCSEAITVEVLPPLPNDPSDKKTVAQKHHAKKVRVSDALREEGLDERGLARTLKGVIDRQLAMGPEDGPDDRFVTSTVMGMLRMLEDEGSGAALGQAPVRLIHNVPRPKRAVQKRQGKRKGKKP